MNVDLENACRILNDGNFTCVLCRGNAMFTSTARGVKPLLDWLDQELDLRGFSAADKVVGKATAFLYCLLGVKAIHTRVISESAVAILKENNIQFSADKIVPFIINRQGNGQCPMEQAVADIVQPQEAPTAIRQKLAQLQYESNNTKKD